MRRLAELYLSRMATLRPRSQRWRAERMRQVLAVVGEVPLEEISVATLEHYAHTRLAQGRSVATVNGELAVWRHAVVCAVRWREETGLAENRLKPWRPLRGPARRPTFLTEEEVQRLVTASAIRGGPCHAFIMLFLATGARPGELLGLQVDDFQGPAVRLPALKGGAVRLVVVPAKVLDDAKRCHASWTHQKVRTHWRSVRQIANLLGVRFYDIRHTVASECLRRGATIRDVQRLLGHQTAKDDRALRTLRSWGHGTRGT